ncbi:MAG: hypothetical protein UY52_C0001G0002 [Parcubacteria group bacterium GW2011_GWC2_49_9]|nr:MAG: hypothetical protein UY34_C0022G0029 [Parcubacteria group bacterium GW2011_GWA2_48_9]KKW16682.1 MAG: hypothetical protein UY52_C0001G0002 [Parcubacteria group bacterium GW2011_GWC2_49_9]
MYFDDEGDMPDEDKDKDEGGDDGMGSDEEPMDGGM